MLQARVTFSRSQIYCYVTIYAICCETTSNKTRVSPKHKAQVNANMRLVIIQIEYTANRNRQTLSQPKPWCNDSGVLNLHHGYYTTIMTSRKLFRHNPVSRGTNQPIRKS